MTLYPVTARPPLLAGAVHRTVRDVAWMSSPDEVMLGGPGGSEDWKERELRISEMANKEIHRYMYQGPNMELETTKELHKYNNNYKDQL